MSFYCVYIDFDLFIDKGAPVDFLDNLCSREVPVRLASAPTIPMNATQRQASVKVANLIPLEIAARDAVMGGMVMPLQERAKVFNPMYLSGHDFDWNKVLKLLPVYPTPGASQYSYED